MRATVLSLMTTAALAVCAGAALAFGGGGGGGGGGSGASQDATFCVSSFSDVRFTLLTSTKFVYVRNNCSHRIVATVTDSCGSASSPIDPGATATFARGAPDQCGSYRVTAVNG
jgi:hypothetical protein